MQSMGTRTQAAEAGATRAGCAHAKTSGFPRHSALQRGGPRDTPHRSAALRPAAHTRSVRRGEVWGTALRLATVGLLLAMPLVAAPAPAAAAPPAADDSAKPPPVRLSEKSWDFGKPKVGGKPERTVTLTNDSDKPVNLTRVRSGCGCVRVVPEKRVIEPGESITLKGTLDTRRERRAAKSTIFIDTDHPDARHLRLVVAYAVLAKPAPKILIEPRTLALGLMLAGRPKVGQVTVKNIGDEELVVTGAPAVGPHAEVDWAGEPPVFPLRLAPKQSTELSIRLLPARAYGLCQKSGRLDSNDPKRPKAFFGVSAYVATRQELEELLRAADGGAAPAGGAGHP